MTKRIYIYDDKKTDRAAFPVNTTLKLLVYQTIDHTTSSKKIADMVIFHDVYKFICDGLTPSARTIMRYRKNYADCYVELLRMTLKRTPDENITDFNHVLC